MAVIIGIILLLFIVIFCLIVMLSIRSHPSQHSHLIRSDNGCYEVAGKKVACSHCGGDDFKSQEILLNTWLLSLLRIDWLDPSSTVLVCKKCGKLTWFAEDE